MADHRPEVNLEIASGFFRIPTESVVYNLTVLGGGDGRLPVVEQIVAQERRQEKATASGGEALLRRVADEVAALARRLLADDTANRLARCRRELSSVLQELAAVSPPSGPAASAVDEARLQGLADRIQEVAELLSGQGANSGAPSAPAEEAPASESVAAVEERYLFDLDVVFQTLYELCTNEQVKTHISTARQNRDEYFDREVFLQEINKVVAGLEPDADNFFNVPMSDLLAALRAGCREKPIRNLLKKMDANQAAIFLDQFLPLEVPPKEEVAVETAAAPSPAPPSEPPAAFSEGGEELVARLRPLVDALQAEIAAITAAMASAAGAAAEADVPGGSGVATALERLRGLEAELAGLTTSLAGETGRRLAALVLALDDTARRAGKEGEAWDRVFASALDAAGGRVESAGPAAVAELLADRGGG